MINLIRKNKKIVTTGIYCYWQNDTPEGIGIGITDPRKIKALQKMFAYYEFEITRTGANSIEDMDKMIREIKEAAKDKEHMSAEQTVLVFSNIYLLTRFHKMPNDEYNGMLFTGGN